LINVDVVRYEFHTSFQNTEKCEFLKVG